MTTILITDDNALMRQGLRSFLLAHDGLSVIGEAQTGVEAVQMALQLHPAVVLMDINMPVMDGLEATREIKGADPHCIVIGLSSHAGLAVQLAMEAAGASAYVAKGDVVRDLYRTICRLIDRAGA